MSTFDDDTLQALRRLPRPLVEEVIQKLDQYYTSPGKGATLEVRRAGRSHQVLVFSDNDEYAEIPLHGA